MKKLKKVMALLLGCVVIATAFTGCFGIEKREKDAENNAEYVLNAGGNDYTLVYYGGKRELDSFEVNEFNGKPVTVIRARAIQSANYLVKLNIGANVTEIQDGAIILNQHLNAIHVDAANRVYCAVDGVLFTIDKTTLVAYPNGHGAQFDINGTMTEKADYDVPEGTVKIAGNAFMKTQALRNVSLPASLRVIGNSAFLHSGLETTSIAESLEIIEDDAFIQCDQENFKQLTLPSTIKSIGSYAFYYCSKLKEITILAPESQVTIGKGAMPTDKGKAIAPIWG